MKIAICGSHGVGKSTISQRISEYLNLPVLPDIVIDAHHSGFVINEGSTNSTQVWLTAKQLENERKHAAFIADKCIYDYHVYAKALAMDQPIIDTTKLIAMEVHDYTHVFYIKPEFEIRIDGGLRSLDPVFQAHVDNTYLEFLQEHNITYTQITWSIENRFEQIVTALKLPYLS